MAYQKIIKNIFGHEDFKSEHQKVAVESILRGGYQNYIVNMATQGGKSLCYQLPGIIKKTGVTVVISPCLAVINDHKNYLNRLNIGAEAIVGDVDRSERDEIRSLISSDNSNIRFLFLTPEIITNNRIMDEALIDWLLEGTVNYLVVDDAHKIIDSPYRESFDYLKELRATNFDIPCIALTTFNPDKIGEIERALSMSNSLVLSSSSVRKNIFYDSIVDGNQPGNTLMDFFNGLRIKEGKNPSGIVFCALRQQIIECVGYLNIHEHLAEAYNDNLTSVERWGNGEFPIIVATGESFGYGVSYQVPAIRFVVHIGMPENLRSFYYESSRAGNHGEQGYSRVYGKINHFNDSNSGEFINYNQADCKRQFIANEFATAKCLNSCDACLNDN